MALVMIAPMPSVSRLQQSQSIRSIRTRYLAATAMIAGGVVLATAVRAVDDATLHIEHVAGEGWSASDVSVEMGLPKDNALARARIGRLHVPALSQTFSDVRIDCPALELRADVIACSKARVVAELASLGKQSLEARLIYGRADGSLNVAFQGLRVGEGRVAIQGALRDSGWNAQVRLQRVPIDALMKLAMSFKAPLPAVSATGLADLTVTARGVETNISAAKVEGAIVDLTANNESGSLASDKLSLQVQAELRSLARQWQFDVAVQSSQGQAFAQPIFVDLGVHAISLRAQGKLVDGKSVTLDRFVLDHADVARASGRGRLQLDQEQPVRDLELDLTALKFPGAYESYLQPLLIDTNFKSLQTAGSLGGTMSIAEGQPQRIDLRFDDVTVDDGVGNLNLSALNGDWHWLDEPSQAGGDDDDAPPARNMQVQQSQLKWQGGSLLGLALGPSELDFSTQGRQFRLMEPARIPVLDGAIDLETFRVRNAGLPSVAFLVDATLQPISVQQLCKAFGWPEFGGTVGGVISKLRMREGVVTLGTTLRAQVFDGDVTISDLRLEQPFGQWPRFYSSIALDSLDLEPMTSAFSFGRITGRLSGAINGLQLFNWTPVAFDARLYTPADDRSRHRISQRAVENIGSIGGGGAGVTAALSGGVMRFFDDFNYDRLGISCRLQNEVCVMDGVGPAQNGNYYLVKGKGLPRIDVIGSSRRVDWPRLVQQLLAVTESGGPVVR
ncbi:MAG TPA: hypothetical protein VGD45_10050 [Steroidobacter sp.]|uniref:hypothetical protein n=1 Tax=Steroidobacter sp. TaxID=1978227 RepID=UPI002ED8EEB9